MADLEQLKLLRRSVGEWNTWRQQQAGLRPDLSGADLSKADLSRADLSKADPSGALPHQESDCAFFKKHTLCGSLVRFQPAHHSTNFPSPKKTGSSYHAFQGSDSW